MLSVPSANGQCENKQLAKFVQPDLDNPNPTFQGYTIFGSYLYTLDGEGHDNPKAINSYITRINMKNGKKEDRRLTKVGDHLDYREPEGMAVYQSGSTPRLLFGFGARDNGGPNRYANVYFLDDFEK